VEGVTVGVPFFHGEYAGVHVVLYPIHYESASEHPMEPITSTGAGHAGRGLNERRPAGESPVVEREAA
jgi:hypothetical protein